MAIDLLKRKVGIVLEKRQLPQVTCEVKFALDISGSMQSLYDNGTVQALTDRLLAVASRFDDNGEMEVWTFTNGFSEAPLVTESMHEGITFWHNLACAIFQRPSLSSQKALYEVRVRRPIPGRSGTTQPRSARIPASRHRSDGKPVALH